MRKNNVVFGGFLKQIVARVSVIRKNMLFSGFLKQIVARLSP